MKEENNREDKSMVDNKNKSKAWKFILLLILIIVLAVGVWFFFIKDKPTNSSNDNTTVISSDEYKNEYRMSGNSLEPFDLYFLQLENQKENKIYSPLSIKYALEMLNEGTAGESKEQISSIIGDYNSNKYTNSENMSLANAMFIKDTYKNTIKGEYISNLKTKYDAEVIYDSFETPANINDWISNKTLNLIDNAIDDLGENPRFMLVNALGIDMEWVNKIQDEKNDYRVSFDHERYLGYAPSMISGLNQLEFDDNTKTVTSGQITAVINKYDIVNELGEDNIRKFVGEKYSKWLEEGASNSCGSLEEQLDVNTYLDNYIEEISKGYGHVSSSTDFYFYTDDNIKVFAKDLKEYNGTTLQYVGIMPTSDSLENYIKNTNSEDINKLINSLKDIEFDNFEEGTITEITGYIPMFKFDYSLDLKTDLSKLGISDIFTPEKADLTNLTTEKNIFIEKTIHKSNIEFSNDGIKASAVTAMGGKGAGDCGFDYLYEVPVKKIDLSFNDPYMFIIRDKSSGEVWFMGTVYEPLSWEEYKQGISDYYKS